MGSAVIGIILGVSAVAFALQSMAVDKLIFFNLAGLVFVLGASFGAIAVTFDIKSLVGVFNSIVTVFTKRTKAPVKMVQTLVDISWQLSKNRSSLSEMTKSNRNSFIGDGLRLVENGFETDRIVEILKVSLIQRKNSAMSQVEVIRTASKYPPAFGMIGTVMGLIALLHGIGPDSNTATIGVAMSVALTTTLYGLFLSNYFFIPMADNLESRLRQDLETRKIVIEGIMMLNEKEDPVLIQETLNAYLKPSERLDFESNVTEMWGDKAA